MRERISRVLRWKDMMIALGRTTHLSMFLEVNLDEAKIPEDAQGHVDAVGVDQALRPEAEHVQERVRGRGEAGEEDAHGDGLGAQLGIGGDGGDEGLGDAVEGEQRDVVAVGGEYFAGAAVGPFGARDQLEQQWRCGRTEDAGDEGDDAVELQDVAEDVFSLPDVVFGFVFRSWFGRGRRCA